MELELENKVETAEIINKVKELLLTCNILLCKNGLMDNTEEQLGYKLKKYPSSQNFEVYHVSYKNPETGKWDIKRSTFTKNEEEAKAFAIKNKDIIIKEYNEKISKKKKKTDNSAFFAMLRNYYKFGSEYLKNDKVNNKPDIAPDKRSHAITIIEKYFIPFFQENNINTIQEIDDTVYSNLKIFLSEQKAKRYNKNLAIKTINNYLIIINRILNYHLRNRLIDRLPYSKGAGVLQENIEEKEERYPLPTESLKGLFQFYNIYDPKKLDQHFSYTVALLSITTGCRPDEVANIKLQDVEHFIIDKKPVFYLKVANKKIKKYTSKLEKYRRIPLHSFVLKNLESYIFLLEKVKKKRLDKTDFLFGIPAEQKETNKIFGAIYGGKRKNSLLMVMKMIKIKELVENGNLDEIKKITKQQLKSEIKNRHLYFDSYRHTFQNLFLLYRGHNSEVKKSGIKINDNLINYFTGHKFDSDMLANYTKINNEKGEPFMNNYGIALLEMLDMLFFDNESEDKAIYEAPGKLYQLHKNIESGNIKIGNLPSDFLSSQIAKILAIGKKETPQQNIDPDSTEFSVFLR